MRSTSVSSTGSSSSSSQVTRKASMDSLKTAAISSDANNGNIKTSGVDHQDVSDALDDFKLAQDNNQNSSQSEKEYHHEMGKDDSMTEPNVDPYLCDAMEIFTVDLRMMKSLRLFFTSTESQLVHHPSLKSKLRSNLLESESNNNSSGQLVIASRESQFKVFHFHFGGLNKLVSVLEDWNFLKKKSKLRSRSDPNRHKHKGTTGTTGSETLDHRQKSSGSCNDESYRERKSSIDSNASGIRKFSIFRPPTSLKEDEIHLEEGIYSELDEDTFKSSIINKDGQISDEFKLRRIVFFGGISPVIRSIIWPFLLQRFPYKSTYDERREMIESDSIKYQEINEKRLNMSPEEKEIFWKKIECTVEKDVPRTDRNNPFFAGDLNQDCMKRILLNYAIYNPIVGYTQGMSDLLAPILIEMTNDPESESFWSFVGLMERTFFVSSPKDSDMDSNLNLLRELIRLLFKEFYDHLKKLPDGLELLFAHRWILLCFKREFIDIQALKIWESCWARYQTDHFHLFVALSVIFIYGQDVIQQDMREDEILFHFSTLSMHMDGSLVLKKARGLLYQFRLLEKIPCTLKKLCFITNNHRHHKTSTSSVSSVTSGSPEKCWDTRFLPSIECVRDTILNKVPHDNLTLISQSESVVFDSCQCFS